jgi:hypothetical protein
MAVGADQRTDAGSAADIAQRLVADSVLAPSNKHLIRSRQSAACMRLIAISINCATTDRHHRSFET